MKQPSWKTPLILSGTLLVVGTFAYWLEYSHKPKKEKLDTAAKKPILLPKDDVQIMAFKIKSAKGLIEGKCDDLAAKKCSIDSKSGSWTLTYPQQLKADDENVRTLLSSVTSQSAPEVIDLSEETEDKRKKLLDEYGLSDQKRTDIAAQFIEVTLEDGKRLTAWFGTEHPLGDKTFVASSTDGNINQKTIFLISNYFKSNFEHDLTYFRDKTAFNFQNGTVESIQGTNTQGKIGLNKVNGAWLIGSPPNALAADYERVDQLISTISKLKAKEFATDDAIKGLKPVLSFSLQYKDGEKPATASIQLYEKTLGAKKEQKKYYAKVSSRKEILEVDAVTRSDLDKKVSSFRQSLLISQTEKAMMTKVKIEGAKLKAPLEFTAQAGKWSQQNTASADQFKVDPKKLETLLEQMTFTRAKDFIAPIPQPQSKTDKNEFEMTLGDDKNAAKSKYRFFMVKDKAYAQDLNSNRNEARLLEDSMKFALPFDPESWKIK